MRNNGIIVSASRAAGLTSLLESLIATKLRRGGATQLKNLLARMGSFVTQQWEAHRNAVPQCDSVFEKHKY